MRLLHVFPVSEREEVQESDDLGLAHSYLIGYVQKHADFPIEYEIVSRDVYRTMEEFKPDIIAITAMTHNFHHAARVASKAKEMGIRTIVGGHHLSNLPGQLTADMDIGVIGEGEVTYLELLDLYRQNKWEPQYLRDVCGIIFRTETDDIHITDPRPLIEDLDSVGHPIREAAPLTRSTGTSLLTSRGCPYKCGFCSQTRFWHCTMRFHSPEYVIEEIERIHAFSGTDKIQIDDGVFLINKRRLLKLIELWEKHPLYKSVSLHCWARANLVDEEMGDIAVRLGVQAVQFGIESNNAETLAYLKGTNVTPEDNQRAYGILAKRGIRVHASFIIGAPQETESQIMDTYAYMKRNRLLEGVVYHLTPIPGTPIWDDAVKRGLVSDDMDFSRLGVSSLGEDAIFLSEVLSRERIVELMRMFDKFWRKRRLYMKFRWFLRYTYTKPWVIPKKIANNLRKLAKPRKRVTGEEY